MCIVSSSIFTEALCSVQCCGDLWLLWVLWILGRFYGFYGPKTGFADADNATALDNLAKAYMSNENFKAAINTWRTAIQQGADDEHIILGLAKAYEKKGDGKASDSMKNEAARIWPGDTPFG
jgi:tetratricopeptide (TPR) repeat protein